MGDPAGCGPLITAKAWQDAQAADLPAFLLITDPNVMVDLCPTQVIERPGEAPHVFSKALPILPLKASLATKPIAGSPDPGFAPAILESIETATMLALSGEVNAVVTNPISKAVLYNVGFKHPGHTEYIASLCGASNGLNYKPLMMLHGGGLKVALATIHIPLMQAAEYLNTDMLIETARTLNASLKRDFGLEHPRIAFTGLNPHAGEDGSIGREEIDIINPAAERLRAEGITISMARPADTVFHEALTGAYDAVIAMTHDQGLIPVKTLDMWGGVNTTLGLPIIRTSPDHGTAYDAAAASTCRADSLIAAIRLAADMASKRAASHG